MAVTMAVCGFSWRSASRRRCGCGRRVVAALENDTSRVSSVYAHNMGSRDIPCPQRNLRSRGRVREAAQRPKAIAVSDGGHRCRS